MSSTDARAAAHVVVVGAGFAGVACAKHLGDAGVPVTLIDKNTYHQFQPLLYQVATAQLAPGDVMRPLRGLFRKHESVNVKLGEVVGIDPVTRTVTTEDGSTFTGDHLVVAVGTEPNFFGVPGAAEHAFPLYSALDAENLRNRMLRLFEDADLEPGRLAQGALNFVIVGGGATGVETAGALADLIHEVMPERYHDLDISAATITLVDHGDVVLAPFSGKAHAYAAEVLEKKGVVLKLGASVTAIEADRAVFADGSHILSRCVVWAGGLKAREIDGLEGLPNVRGRISVGANLSVEGFPGVYAVGDGAAGTDLDGNPYPQLGSVALQAGGAVANSILAAIDGKPAPAFKYHDKGIMAMIGHGAAVAEMGKHHHELHGSIAFAAWLGVHAWLLNTTRARIDAFINWAWDSFSNSRGPAIIDDPDAPRIDWTDVDGEIPESIAPPAAARTASP
jgi:NADH dehydrogenase